MIACHGLRRGCSEQTRTTPRSGGVSIGEGGWRLAPLSEDRCISCHVPFNTAQLGKGVWQALRHEAEADRVKLSLRGNKSSGQ